MINDHWFISGHVARLDIAVVSATATASVGVVFWMFQPPWTPLTPTLAYHLRNSIDSLDINTA